MTPLLTRIAQQLSISSDPDERAELMAERACYLARVGNFEEANSIVATLRRTYGDGHNARVSVWLMLAEGLILYFDKISSSAYDRIRRAAALGAYVHSSKLHALTNAWCAHVEFERAGYDAMVSAILRVFEIGEGAAHDARCRAAMVLADSYLYIGMRQASQVWYDNARIHALEAGDQAAIGALIYNRAIFGLASVRLSKYLEKEQVQAVILKSIAMELDSAVRFQFGTGVTALSHLIQHARAQIWILEEQWHLALDVLTQLHDRADVVEERPNRSTYLIDLALVLLRLGRRAEASKSILNIDIDRLRSLDIDEQLICFARLVDIFDIIGDEGSKSRFQIEAIRAEAECRADIDRLRAAMSRVSVNL